MATKWRIMTKDEIRVRIASTIDIVLTPSCNGIQGQKLKHILGQPENLKLC